MTDARLWQNTEQVVGTNKTNGQIQSLAFPKDIGNVGMRFTFSKYTFGGNGNISSEAIGSIMLPLPTGFQESYSINIKAEQIGLGGALVGDAMAGNVNIGKMVDAFSNTATGALISDPAAATNFMLQSGLATAAAGAVGKVFGNGIGGAITGAAGSQAIGSGIAVASGTAYNPHTALMFEGINVRSHDFTWTLSPKSESEGRVLRDVIKTFKRNALPSYQGLGGSTSGTALDRVLLRYPNVVDVSFVGLDESYYYRFKTCMVTQIGVDYSPHGNAMFAGEAGSKPVAITLALSLIESKIHTADDFDTGA